MTEEVKDDELEGAEEKPERPTPVISAGSAAEGSAQPGLDAEGFAKRLDDFEQKLEKLPDLVDARFKSGKDVRFSKVDEIYEWVKASGGDPEKIRMSLERSAYEDRLSKLEAQVLGGAGGSAPTRETQGYRFSEDRTAEILNEAGVTWDNPEVVAWTGRTFASDIQAEAALKAAVAKGKKQENVGAGASAGPTGSSAQPKGDTYEELAEELANLRGKFDPESQKLRTEIQAKLAKLERDMVFVETSYDAFGPR
jgi:hypothetical protein